MIVFMISKRSVEFYSQLYSNALDQGWLTCTYLYVCVHTYIMGTFLATSILRIRTSCICVYENIA